MKGKRKKNRNTEWSTEKFCNHIAMCLSHNTTELSFPIFNCWLNKRKCDTKKIICNLMFLSGMQSLQANTIFVLIRCAIYSTPQLKPGMCGWQHVWLQTIPARICITFFSAEKKKITTVKILTENPMLNPHLVCNL